MYSGSSAPIQCFYFRYAHETKPLLIIRLMMTKHYDSGENFVPDVIAEADLIWRPGFGEPQNPVEEDKVLNGTRRAAFLERPVQKEVLSHFMSDNFLTKNERNSKSSRGIERIRAMKEAFKRQLKSSEGAEQFFSDLRSNEFASFTRSERSEVPDSARSPRSTPRQESREALIVKLSEDVFHLQNRLQDAVQAIQMLKDATLKLISSKDDELASMKTKLLSNGNQLKLEPGEPQCNNMDTMADIFDEVFEVLTDDSPLRSFQPDFSAPRDDYDSDTSGKLPRRCRRMSAGNTNIPNTRNYSVDTADRLRRLSPDSYSCSVGDRSLSPTIRVRRNSVDQRIMLNGSVGPAPTSAFSSSGERSPSPTGRARRNSTDLRIMLGGSFGPAPAGGFQRLANMECNALLSDSAGGQITPAPAVPEKLRTVTKIVDSTNLKIPLVRTYRSC